MAKRWYVVHTYSGYENKVKTDLEHRIETYGMQDQIVDIQIPTEKVTKVKDGGERVDKDEKVFPGYTTAGLSSATPQASRVSSVSTESRRRCAAPSTTRSCAA